MHRTPPQPRSSRRTTKGFAARRCLWAALTVVSLTACTSTNPQEVNDSAGDREYTTPVSSDVGFLVTPESSGQYEVRVRVFEKADYDEETGNLSVSYLKEDGRRVTTGIDPVPCGYEPNVDIVVPIHITLRATTSTPLAQEALFSYIETDYGFQPTQDAWPHYVNTIGFVNDCQILHPGDNAQLAFEVEAAGSTDSDQPSTSLRFMLIDGTNFTSEAERQEFLSKLALSVSVTSAAGPGRLELEYLDPEDTRLLRDNGCFNIMQPLTVEVPNAAWTTPAEQECNVTNFVMN